MVNYTYDPYGKLLSTTGSKADILGLYNPFRYRGYVYDHETGLYYLQSRYYDPAIGRFINADSFASTGQGLLGNNMFVAPSLTGAILKHLGILNIYYYDLPWERIAEEYADVGRGGYATWSKYVAFLYWIYSVT